MSIKCQVLKSIKKKNEKTVNFSLNLYFIYIRGNYDILSNAWFNAMQEVMYI